MKENMKDKKRGLGKEGEKKGSWECSTNVGFRMFWMQSCLQFSNWAFQPREELLQYAFKSWNLIKSEDSLLLTTPTSDVAFFTHRSIAGRKTNGVYFWTQSDRSFKLQQSYVVYDRSVWTVFDDLLQSQGLLNRGWTPNSMCTLRFKT